MVNRDGDGVVTFELCSLGVDLFGGEVVSVVFGAWAETRQLCGHDGGLRCRLSYNLQIKYGYDTIPSSSSICIQMATIYNNWI